MTSPKFKFWVSMTDKFMSGWGMAEGKTNKLIISCETYEQAEQIKRNAEKRTEMKYINICIKKPYYNSRYYLVSEKSYYEMGGSWIQ